MKNNLQAPFPYFGGKTMVADIIWQALGQPKHYIEPFFGTGAILLNRPNYNPQLHVETINDKDGFISNLWRALQKNPDEVAKYCDYPVNHADLSARKKYLLIHENNLLEKLINDNDYYDAKMAGYWIWAASCWIGSGLTSPDGRPHIGDVDMGVHKISQVPHISHTGKGVHKIGKIPHIGNAGKGVQDPYNINIYKWFRKLSERLRYVRVVCGDWTRVCGGNWQDNIGDVGIFFDPPYGVTDRHTSLYHHDSTDIAKEVMKWCRERGKIDTYRIVLAGYEEHEELLLEGWTKQNWKASGGYSNLKDKDKKNNRHRECLYFSPHCIKNTLF